LVILTEFGDRSIPVLLANVPMAKKLHGSHLTRAELKERVIKSIASLEMIGQNAFPLSGNSRRTKVYCWHDQPARNRGGAGAHAGFRGMSF
jgi:hypothetical protein